MDEYIEREKAIGMAISGRIRTLPTTEDGEDWIRVKEVRESLHSIPAADVAPVVHGEWQFVRKRLARGGYVDGSKCSVCDKMVMPHLKPNYCPNCGARMDQGGDA